MADDTRKVRVEEQLKVKIGRFINNFAIIDHKVLTIRLIIKLSI